MARLLLTTLTLLILLVPSVQAGDDFIPNLIGKWEGQAKAIIVGSSDHKGVSKEPTTHTTPWVIEIQGQKGRFFWGTSSSPEYSESIIGQIDPDGHSIYIVEEDGMYIGKIIGNKMIINYIEVHSKSRVAAYSELVKVKK